MIKATANCTNDKKENSSLSYLVAILLGGILKQILQEITTKKIGYTK